MRLPRSLLVEARFLLARSHLFSRLESATGRSGADPDRTFTRRTRWPLSHELSGPAVRRRNNNGQPGLDLPTGLSSTSQRKAGQLREGVMTKIVRSNRSYSAEVVSPVGIYSRKSVRDAALEPQLLKGVTTGGLLKVHSVRRDAPGSELRGAHARYA